MFAMAWEYMKIFMAYRSKKRYNPVERHENPNNSHREIMLYVQADHARYEHLFGPGRDPGLLMDIDTHPVSGAVSEAFTIPCPADIIPCGRVDVGALYTGRYGSLRRFLGRQTSTVRQRSSPSLPRRSKQPEARS